MSPNKRPIDIAEAFTPEEQHHVLKRLKTHHITPDGTLTLQAANRKHVKLLPLPTPHVGSSTSSRETRRLRSRAHETLLHAISTPSNTSNNEHDDETSQLTAIILLVCSANKLVNLFTTYSISWVDSMCISALMSRVCKR